MLNSTRIRLAASFLGISFFVCLAVGSSDSEKSKDVKRKAFFSAYIFAKEDLKSPSSADVEMYDPSLVTPLGDDLYRVSTYVDAKNSFGTELRERFSCTVRYIKETDNFQLVDGINWE